MALIDTAFDTVQDALANVTEIASGNFETVGATLNNLAEEERSRKRLVILLILLVLAVLGFLAWKKSSSSSADPETTTA
jgi:hypothetical protein